MNKLIQTILVTTLAVLWVTSCDKLKKEGGEQLQIKGTVEHANDGFIVLKEVGDSAVISLDSVKLKGNAFEFNITPKQKAFYYIDLFKKQNVFIVGGPGEKISVTADGSSETGTFTVKGSTDNDNMKKAVDLITAYQKESNELQTKYMNLQQQGKAQEAEAFLTVFDSAYNAKVNEAKTLITGFGPTLPAMSLAANFISPKKDLPFLEDLSAKMLKEMPDSRYTKNFAEFVAANKVLSVGTIAPDFTASTPNDQWMKLSDLRGKVILIDFWASWCKPCRAENPNVVKMYGKYKDKGFDILSFSLDESKEDWKAAIKADGLTWNHVSDLKGWASPLVSTYKIEGIPATYLIDKEGKIIAINLRGAELEKKLAEVLN